MAGRVYVIMLALGVEGPVQQAHALDSGCGVQKTLGAMHRKGPRWDHNFDSRSDRTLPQSSLPP